MDNQYGNLYQDLINKSTIYSDSLNLSENDPSSVPYIDASQNLADYILTNGQVLIGSSGNIPVPNTLTGSANIIITNGAGSIAMDSVQPIQTTSSVTFGSITDSSLASALVNASSAGLLQDTTLSNTNANGTSNTLSFTGSTLTMASSMTQNLATSGQPTFHELTIDGGTSTIINLTTTGGGSVISHVDGTGAKWVDSVEGGFIEINSKVTTNNNTLDDGSGNAIFLGNMTIDGLTASLPVHTNGSKELITGAISLTSDITGTLGIANGGTNSGTALTNGNIMVSSGGQIVEGTSASAPSFSGTVTAGQIIDSGLTASLPVHTNASKELITSAISLTADVTGVVPIANGGSNSGTALANGSLMVSNSGQIVEGTSSSSPNFSQVILTDSGLQVIFQPGGSGNSITLTVPSNPVGNTRYTIPDLGVTVGDFVMDTGTQTINGVKTFTSAPVFTGLTASTALYLDASNKLTGVALADGQMLIGVSGGHPVANNISGSASIIVTPGAGSIALDTIQPITTTSAVTFNSVSLQTTGGTPTALNYYEEYAHSTTWSGPIATTSAISCAITRIGRFVQFKVPQVSGTGNNTAAQLVMTTAIPARFCPSGPLFYESILTQAAGAFSIGYLMVPTNGVLTFGQTFTGNFSANTQPTGTVDDVSVCWNV